MMSKKGIFATIILLVVAGGIALLAGRLAKNQAVPENSGKLRVVASFYPLAEFAQQVGGDKVTVTNLTPAGSEPHDFDPTPQDIVTLYNSQVFIYNGAGLETWVDRVLPEVQKRGAVVVRGSDGIKLLAGIPEESESVQPVPDASLSDPHFWLDPVLAVKEVSNIENGLIQADPTNREYYQMNAQAYIEKINTLDQEYKIGLAQCAQRDIVTSHSAFAYLAQRYGLKQISISGLSPDAEPSPARLVSIAKIAQQKKIAYIFFETLVSPRISETIANEIGAATIAFNPLEGLTDKELEQGMNYLSVQEENLANLRIALGCNS